MSAEERAILRKLLLAWKRDGNPNPIIPAYRDEDGDGVPDFYGLDENDEVVVVSGVTVADTVAAAPAGEDDGGSA